jgi:hypothetical protein
MEKRILDLNLLLMYLSGWEEDSREEPQPKFLPPTMKLPKAKRQKPPKRARRLASSNVPNESSFLNDTILFPSNFQERKRNSQCGSIARRERS